MIWLNRRYPGAWRFFLAVAVCSSTAVAGDNPVSQERQAADTAEPGSASGGEASSKSVAPATAQSVETAPPAVSPAEIAAWITELDSNRYLDRERATQRLFLAGSAALDPLLAAANGERPEPADRAVWILRRLSTTKDRALRRQALERLVTIANRPRVTSAAQEMLAQIRHEEAVEAIERLGGRFIVSEYASQTQYGQRLVPRVELDEQWRGRDEDMTLLRDLILVRQVIIIGTNITANALSQLQQVDGLTDVWLYGTRLEQADVAHLQALIPQVSIDYRRGALLGVLSIATEATGPPIVGKVQPGSAAADAGIQDGDVIQKFQGQDVSSFKALTTMISEHRAGDEVVLEVLRGGQPREIKVKLGKWQ